MTQLGSTHVRATGAGTPLVLIHGVGLDLEIWEPLVPRLQQGRRVIRYDMQGHGLSEKPSGPYHLADFVSQFDRLAGALGLDRFDVAGFSLGALVAAAFTAQCPARVTRLAMVSSIYDRNPAQRAAVAQRLAQVEAGEIDSSIAAAIERWLTPGFRASRPDAAIAIQQRLRTNDRAAYLASYRVFATADPEIIAAVERIRCPTLVLTGEEDVGSTPAMARALAARLPDATLAILPGLRHLPMIEAPEKVADALDRFFVL